MKDFLSQAAKLLKEQKQYRRRITVFLCLAVIVGYGTVMALKLYGQAMTHQVEVLDCQYEVHEHTDECYETDEEGNRISEEPVCGYADYVIHVHNDACYDKDGELVCTLEEHELHVHTEECYVTEKILVCGETAEGDGQEADGTDTGIAGEVQTPTESSEAAESTESEAVSENATGTEDAAEPQQDEIICGKEAHQHDESCYENVLSCDYAEEHVHTADCISHELDCEIAEHAHGEECYDAEGNLICGLEEHTHVIGCYDEEGNTLCNTENHIHDESCLNAEGKIACGPEGHEHIVGCYRNYYSCGKEAHVHSESCYTQTLICGLEEHEHEDTCYAPATAPAETGTDTAESSAAEETAVPEETAAPEGSGATEHVHTDACYQEVTRLVCGEQELHIHDDSCYTEDCFDEEGKLIEGSRPSCGLLQLEEHVHSGDCFKVVELTPEEVAALNQGAKLHIHEEDCYDEEGNLICGHDATHIHVLECYDDAGKLICGYGTASHVHENKCYDEEGNLICGYETASHVHEESCYDKNGNLICGYDTAVHVHEESCYDEEGNLVCGYETASHVHEDSCYDEAGELICGYDTASHVHSEECYDKDGNLLCGYDAASHVHEKTCYDEEGNLICGYESIAHVHEDSCYDRNGNLICGYETAAHIHDRNCYDEDGKQICGYETVGHVHNDECYDEEGNLICGYDEDGSVILPLYCKESIHAHDEDCYDENGNLVCGKADYAVHTHGESCYGSAGELICILPEIEAHTHTDACYGEDGTLTCGKEEIQLHKHTEECYDGDGNLICGQLEVLEHIHSAACKVSQMPVTKTYQNEAFVITATYSAGANIPKEAELIAEQITEEDDEAHYAERQAQYQEALGDSKATMRALLKVGFYVNGQEVEPEDTVTITIQFLDENGLAEGKPVTIIHFAEEGTELLEGSEVENGSTTFEMESFSEIAVGYGVENVKVPVDETIDYDTDAFHITFRIEGDVTLPVDEASNREADAAVPDDSQGDDTSSASSGAAEGAEEQADDTAEAPGSRTEPGAADVFTVPVENDALVNDFEFRVESLDEASEEYTAVVAYGEEIGDGGEELLLQVWSYSLNYNGEEVDLSDCKVTAEITPSQALVDAAKEAAVMLAGGPEEIDNLEEEPFGELEHQNGFTISVMGLSEDAEIGDIETAEINEDSDAAEVEPIVIELTSGYLAARASGQPNPKFTVQFYANLEVVAYNDPTLRKVIGSTSYTNELPVIDTTGGKLPANGGGVAVSPNGNEIRNLYVDMATGKLQTKTELTEVYSSRPFEYHKAPTINYMNALVENPNYELKEVWILKEGKEADSTERNDWDIHTYSKDLHFTNREVSAESGEYVLIRDNATMRFVYDTTDNDNKFKVAFYDYDIGDGYIYSTQASAQNQTNRKNTSTQGTDAYYMHTKQSGINSPGNYTGSGKKLAFGNANTGSGLQHEIWEGNLLNKHNGTQGGHPSVAGSYKGCTFGLVTGLVDGKVQYAKGVIAPNLFNDGSADGKSSYDNDEFSLTFNRVGDTFTLTSVNGTGTNKLDTFNHPSPNASTVHNHIWTNDFWPMDSAKSFGADGHDMKFGNYTNRNNYMFAGQAGSSGGNAAANGTFPWSDDGVDHNSYFGMHYKVEFDLVKDYVGPLEYYFFGDDDMWVFLDGKLVCDIGGVHSSVGEYVNLWDYLEKGSEESAGKHTLSFFYTERGESGSTCWMQFTLPSVSSLTPETSDDDFGHLKIEKTVTLIEDGEEKDVTDNNDEFTFTVHFTDANGKNLPDDYSYVKYDKDGKEIGADLIIWDGGEFTLKNGEYIIVKYLPKGTKYTITESNAALTVTDNTTEASKVEYFTDITIGGDSVEGKEDLDDNKTVDGTISSNDTSEVKYINKIYHYALPETGGSGTILYTMAGGIVVLFGAGFLYRKKFRERRG